MPLLWQSPILPVAKSLCVTVVAKPHLNWGNVLVCHCCSKAPTYLWQSCCVSMLWQNSNLPVSKSLCVTVVAIPTLAVAKSLCVTVVAKPHLNWGNVLVCHCCSKAPTYLWQSRCVSMLWQNSNVPVSKSLCVTVVAFPTLPVAKSLCVTVVAKTHLTCTDSHLAVKQLLCCQRVGRLLFDAENLKNEKIGNYNH